MKEDLPITTQRIPVKALHITTFKTSPVYCRIQPSPWDGINEALMFTTLYNIHVYVLLSSQKKKRKRTPNILEPERKYSTCTLFVCLRLIRCNRHGPKPASNLCESRALCWIWGPTLLHEPSPLRVTWRWHRWPQCVVYDAPCKRNSKSYSCANCPKEQKRLGSGKRGKFTHGETKSSSDDTDGV
jgi:hypothetical protein